MVNGLILFKGKLKETDFYQLDELKRKYDFKYEKKATEKKFEEKYMK